MSSLCSFFVILQFIHLLSQYFNPNTKLPIFVTAQQQTYAVCGSAVVAPNDDLVLQQFGCDDEDRMTNCSSANDAICIRSIRRSSSSVLDRLACIPGLCDGEDSNNEGDDQLITVSWGFRKQWITTCDPNCEEQSKIYQRCLTNDECTALGEQFCCSRPSIHTIRAGSGCGPPRCYDCDTADCVDENCPPLHYGTCIDSTVSDIRPGYSCQNDPCLESLDWAEQVCGYDRPNNSFLNPRKACSNACTNAMDLISDCVNTSVLPDSILDRLKALRSTYEAYGGCRICGHHYYERCASTSDCPVGYCCSLPPDQLIPGFFDPENSCGPPESCWCNYTIVDDNSFTEQFSCTSSTVDDCSAPGRQFGTCIEVGTADPRNPVYSCNCSDPDTFSRTEAPTTLTSAYPTDFLAGSPRPTATAGPSIGPSPSTQLNQPPNSSFGPPQDLRPTGTGSPIVTTDTGSGAVNPRPATGLILSVIFFCTL